MGYIGKENRFCFGGIFLEFDIAISLRFRGFGLLLGRARLSVLLGGVDKEIDAICRGVFPFEELRLLMSHSRKGGRKNSSRRHCAFRLPWSIGSGKSL